MYKFSSDIGSYFVRGKTFYDWTPCLFQKLVGKVELTHLGAKALCADNDQHSYELTSTGLPFPSQYAYIPRGTESHT